MTRLAGLLSIAILLCACAGGGAAEVRSPTTTVSAEPDEAPSGHLMVFAAASLRDVLNVVAAQFEAHHPDVEVTLSFAGSQQLAGQIRHGAPADVFLSADITQMRTVADAGLLADTPEVVTGNAMAIAVEPGNPLRIDDLRDLARADVTVVMAAEDVPAGRYARELLAAEGVDVAPASLEIDVRAVLSKVALGEADAGIVYRSDIVATGDDVERVPLSTDHDGVVSYPAAVLADASNPAAARRFVDYLHSNDAQQAFHTFGFSTP